MNFGEAKAYLISLINRKDISDTLASQFIQQSQGRLERNLRPSFMQKLVSFTVTPDADDPGAFSVPTDMLEIIDLYGDCVEVERVDVQTFLRRPTGTDAPTVFVQTGNTIRLRPIPAATQTMYLSYYSAQPKLTVDTDENSWSVSCTDALIFGAAILAAHHFEDERLQSFSDQYTTFVSEISDQALREDFSGAMRIQGAYSYQDY